MKIILADKKEEMIEAWRNLFSDFDDVEIIQGDITKIKCDAIVSPANSFGFMDGGLDYAISDRLGWHLQTMLQKMIKELPEGELLVGKALILETNDAEIPFLISAPTMRIPTNFNISSSVNAYLAMKAALIQAKIHPDISSMSVSGLCTGVGRMDFDICAKQMFTAYKEIILGEKMDFQTFGDAQKYHWKINLKGMIWMH
ncbi:macro domain-containing protein [Emticicia sediminis]